MDDKESDFMLLALKVFGIVSTILLGLVAIASIIGIVIFIIDSIF